MKKYFKTFIPLIIGLFFLQSCEEGDQTIDYVFDNVTRGATLRTMNLISPSYDLEDPNSVFSVLLEYRDNEQGALLQSYVVYAAYQDNNDDGTDISKPEAQIDVINASDFTNGPNNFPEHTYSAALSTVLGALGIDFDETSAIRFSSEWN